jgi:hypothetical protein
MASIGRRVSALEDYVYQLVEERMKQEVEAMLDLLEEHLTREEFIKVARIVVEEGGFGA